jgi:hypothetical protein
MTAFAGLRSCLERPVLARSVTFDLALLAKSLELTRSGLSSMCAFGNQGFNGASPFDWWRAVSIQQGTRKEQRKL